MQGEHKWIFNWTFNYIQLPPLSHCLSDHLVQLMSRPSLCTSLTMSWRAELFSWEWTVYILQHCSHCFLNVSCIRQVNYAWHCLHQGQKRGVKRAWLQVPSAHQNISRFWGKQLGETSDTAHENQWWQQDLSMWSGAAALRQHLSTKCLVVLALEWSTGSNWLVLVFKIIKWCDVNLLTLKVFILACEFQLNPVRKIKV